MKNVKWFVIGGLVILVVGFLLGYLIFPKTEIRYEIREVDVDSTKIYQEARLGWVAENELSDAYKALEKERTLRFTKVSYKTAYIDSVIVRDSVAVRDSVVVRYIPFFAADTNFTFAKKTDQWEFDTNIGIRTRFYPRVRLMETNAVMNSLNITVTYKQPWRFDFLSSGVGFGVGTAFTAVVVYLTK